MYGWKVHWQGEWMIKRHCSPQMMIMFVIGSAVTNSTDHEMSDAVGMKHH